MEFEGITILFTINLRQLLEHHIKPDIEWKSHWGTFLRLRSKLLLRGRLPPSPRLAGFGFPLKDYAAKHG
jgi:hypothetical protein